MATDRTRAMNRAASRAFGRGSLRMLVSCSDGEAWFIRADIKTVSELPRRLPHSLRWRFSGPVRLRFAPRQPYPRHPFQD